MTTLAGGEAQRRRILSVPPVGPREIAPGLVISGACL